MLANLQRFLILFYLRHLVMRQKMLRVDKGFWRGKIFSILVRYMSLLSEGKGEGKGAAKSWLQKPCHHLII